MNHCISIKHSFCVALLLGALNLPFQTALASVEVGVNPSSESASTHSLNASPQGTSSAFILNLGNQAISIMSDQSLTHEQRTNKYRSILHASFDMPTIARFVIGHSWNSATPDQQNEYMRRFEEIVLRNYGDRLNFFSGEEFRIRGVQQEKDDEFIVSSEITHADASKPTKIDWRVRWKNGEAKVIDIAVEGVSQCITQRQEYSAIIQRDGGKIDGLLSMMREQTQGIHP